MQLGDSAVSDFDQANDFDQDMSTDKQSGISC